MGTIGTVQKHATHIKGRSGASHSIHMRLQVKSYFGAATRNYSIVGYRLNFPGNSELTRMLPIARFPEKMEVSASFISRFTNSSVLPEVEIKSSLNA